MNNKNKSVNEQDLERKISSPTKGSPSVVETARRQLLLGVFLSSQAR